MNLSRRDALSGLGAGFGSIALSALLSDETRGEAATSAIPHHLPKCKRVLQLFMNGGASQVDTFDYKPELIKRHGEKIDFGIKSAATSEPGAVMKSPFEWKQHGETARWVTSVFPHMAQHVDELAFLYGMASKTNVHGPASYMQNT